MTRVITRFKIVDEGVKSNNDPCEFSDDYHQFDAMYLGWGDTFKDAVLDAMTQIDSGFDSVNLSKALNLIDDGIVEKLPPDSFHYAALFVDFREADKKVSALAGFLNIPYQEAEKEIRDENYLVLTDDEAYTKASQEIKESLWAFRASFICKACGLEDDLEDMIEAFQEKRCEGANVALESLVEKTIGFNDFVDKAISADGMGHFIASYDGKQHCHDGLNIYRIN